MWSFPKLMYLTKFEAPCGTQFIPVGPEAMTRDPLVMSAFQEQYLNPLQNYNLVFLTSEIKNTFDSCGDICK